MYVDGKITKIDVLVTHEIWLQRRRKRQRATRLDNNDVKYYVSTLKGYGVPLKGLTAFGFFHRK